jgi:hypothetical protein
MVTSIALSVKRKELKDIGRLSRKELTGKGLGNKKNRADPFTSEEIDSLYRQKLLGNILYQKKKHDKT